MTLKSKPSGGAAAGAPGLLVTSPGDTWRDGIVSALASAGRAVVTGGSLRETLGALPAARRAAHLHDGADAGHDGVGCDDPDFVMAGPSLDDSAWEALAREAKANPATASAPLLLGRPDCSSVYRPDRAAILPDGFFLSPDGAAGLVADGEARRREERLNGLRRTEMRGRSDPASVEALWGLAADLTRRAMSVVGDETESYRTLSAFREAVDNAAHHGNGGSREKFVSVLLVETREAVTIEVRDEGPGFDGDAGLRAVRSGDAARIARDRLARGRPGGLGIKLMTECADEVRYSDGGRCLTLVKRLRRKDPGSERG